MLLLSTFPPFHGHHESPWRRNKSQSAIHNKLRKRHGKGGTKILRPFQSIATSGRPILHQSPILIYRQGPLPPPPSYPGETLPPSQGCSGSRDLNSHRLFRRLNRVRACHAFGLSQFKPIGSCPEQIGFRSIHQYARLNGWETFPKKERPGRGLWITNAMMIILIDANWSLLL